MSISLVVGVSIAYVAFLFFAAWYADRRREQGRSIIANSTVYSLSIAVYLTTWTYYGSVGKAATSGLDYLLIYLGPSLVAFAWWFLLRKIVRISKASNVTSIADFISSRYGKSQLLGSIVAVIAILGNMPYIALQLKAVSSSFRIISGESHIHLHLGAYTTTMHPAFLSALILSLFSVIFGARMLMASERHEGLVAAVAVESFVKLAAFLFVGIYITYFLFDGFTDIFTRMHTLDPQLLNRLTTIGGTGETSYPQFFSLLYLSMGAIMLLPRQFHIMVIENSDEQHIKKAMWLFPMYMFLINLFVMPIALGGILYTRSTTGADYFVLTIPLASGNSWLSLIAFLGGFSAAAGMVMVASVALSTMFLNHLLMPIVVKFRPRTWFPTLLTNLKRLSIFLIIFLGFFYQYIVGDTYMLVNIGLISFAAVAQFGPALIGGLYWRRGNKIGAISGIVFGFLVWGYTLLLPSFIESGWLSRSILDVGPFGISLLKPTQLFGLTGFDIWTNSLFWSMFFNIGCYLIFSILLHQEEEEREQARKFVGIFEQKNGAAPETKRLSKPITINQFINLMSKFIGEQQTNTAIRDYLGNRKLEIDMGISEFELPKLKRFTEKTLAGSVGAAAAGAIVESYLSDVGSKMEPVYDIFSTVRASLDESRENLYVRLRASEIMIRTLDLQIIMDDLLDLLLKEFKLDLGIVWLKEESGTLVARSSKGWLGKGWGPGEPILHQDPALGESFLSNRVRFVNDVENLKEMESFPPEMKNGVVRSFAHIPIARQGEPPVGILSVYSKNIAGLFTEQFLRLLSSLTGQLAQAVKIVSEMEDKERERQEKERAQVENARVMRDMELAKQIQFSLLPASPPQLKGAQFASLCVQATHVGGDYYDFFYQAEDSIDLVIADVSGHNVGAALIMVETRSVLRAQIHSALSASEILLILNQLLYEDLSSAELFISMFYAKYNSTTHILTYANAGHNPPLLFRHGEPSCLNLDADGLILGVKKDVLFEEVTMELREEDILLLYTDGITEAQDTSGELFGIERLCEVISTNRDKAAEEIIAAVLKAVEEFSRSATLQDDISLVVMKVGEEKEAALF